jgi:hypothetical protein
MKGEQNNKTIKALMLAIACSFFAFEVMAQEKSSYQSTSTFDVAASAGTGTFSGSLSWSNVHRLTKKLPNLKVGYGVRFTTFVAANKFYVTAPAKFTSPIQNLGTIFSETIEKNIDTITTATTLTNSLNLAIYIQYSITPKIDVGFNIDAVGFSFGPKKQFNVISNVFDPNQSPVPTGSPTRFFLRYWISKKIGLRAGYTFLFGEYKLDTKLSFDAGRIMNDRYRYKASMLMLGVTYKPFDQT